MNILAKLKSGELHAKARIVRAECVDTQGNIHCSAKRAKFVDWLAVNKIKHGDDVSIWPITVRMEHAEHYTPSH